MPLFGRVIMGLLAIFIAWTLLRALRNGRIFSRGYGFTIDDQPMMFVLAMATHGLMVFFLLWLAAGYDIDSFLRHIGLEWLNAKR